MVPGDSKQKNILGIHLVLVLQCLDFSVKHPDLSNIKNLFWAAVLFLPGLAMYFYALFLWRHYYRQTLQPLYVLLFGALIMALCMLLWQTVPHEVSEAFSADRVGRQLSGVGYSFWGIFFITPAVALGTLFYGARYKRQMRETAERQVREEAFAKAINEPPQINRFL